MDLDYRTLGNAGVWSLGRLQTNADRARVIEAMSSNGAGAHELDDIVKRLAPRWFAMRDLHANDGVALLQPRLTLSWMRGPMTRTELRRALDAEKRRDGTEPTAPRTVAGRWPLGDDAAGSA